MSKDSAKRVEPGRKRSARPCRNLARKAAERLRAVEQVRRRADAQQLQHLVELAAYYRVGYDDIVEALVEGVRHYGGDGTPEASEFLALEVAGLLGCTPGRAAGLIADALDLRYRHRVLWDAVQALELEAARACRAARMCHGLPAPAAEWAGQQWLAKQSGLSWGAAFNLLEKLIIEADPALAAERETSQRHFRDVYVWKSHQGVARISGSLDLLDAKYLEGTVNQLADILEGQAQEPTPRGVFRAKALAALCSPAYALSLLQAAAQQTLPGTGAERVEPAPGLVEPVRERSERTVSKPSEAPPANSTPAGDAPEVSTPSAAAAPEGLNHPDDPWGTPPGDRAAQLNPHTPGTSLPGHVCGTITVPPARLHPKVSVNIHLHIDPAGRLSPAARIEHAEYLTTATLAGFLAGHRVKLQPIIDLNQAPVEDGYTPSDRLRRAVGLVYGHDQFPYTTTPAAHCDLDHTEPYQLGGVGQTRLDNLAPINRRAHRAKTAGIWRLRRVEALHWVSPLGFEYLVTPDRTQALAAG